MDSYYPDEWFDEKRMSVLMSAMPIDKNSAAYNGRIVFWKKSIQRWLAVKKKVCFAISDVVTAFQRETMEPICIPDVVLHLVKQKELMKLEEFMKLTPKQEMGWLRWSMSKLTDMSLSMLDLTQLSRIESHCFYIYIPAIETAANEVTMMYWKSPNVNTGIQTLQDVFPLVANALASVDELELVVHYLLLHHKASISKHRNETLVKFLAPGRTHCPAVKEIEEAKFDLARVQKKLKCRISSITSEIENLQVTAKKYVSTNCRSLALQCLRKKKRLESQLSLLVSSEDNVTVTLEKLEQSELNREILEAYKVGLEMMRSSTKSSGLDSTANILNEIKDTVSNCDEISGSLATNVEDISVEDLEEEFSQMMKEIKYELPDIPTSDPFASPVSTSAHFAPTVTETEMPLTSQ